MIAANPIISAVEVLGDAPALPLSPLDSTSIDDIEWVGRDEAIVVWSWVYSGFVTVSLVSYEIEAADPSVGYAAGATADGDCPQKVIDYVAEIAFERACEDDSCEEYEPDDRDQYEHDADERDAQEAF